MRTIPGTAAALIGLAAATALLPGTALADRHWRGHDIQHFHDRDFGRWQSGYWHHGPHLGRLGWWWVAGGLWYFYPQPVYPYPDPYVPPVVVVPRQAPVPVEPAVVAPAPQYWYYCDESKAYYPYVATCRGGWRQVPATPAP